MDNAQATSDQAVASYRWGRYFFLFAALIAAGGTMLSAATFFVLDAPKSEEVSTDLQKWLPFITSWGVLFLVLLGTILQFIFTASVRKTRIECAQLGNNPIARQQKEVILRGKFIVGLVVQSVAFVASAVALGFTTFWWVESATDTSERVLFGLMFAGFLATTAATIITMSVNIVFVVISVNLCKPKAERRRLRAFFNKTKKNGGQTEMVEIPGAAQMPSTALNKKY